MTETERNLLKVVVPLAGIGLVMVVSRLRGMSLRDEVGIKAPAAGPAAAWVVLYAAYMLVSDALMHWRGAWDFQVWQEQTLLVSVCRVLGVGVLGPIAEELIFRGMLFGRLTRVLNVHAVIVLMAVAWGAIHYTYTPGVIALITGGGVLLGLARHQTRSVVTPILMHMVWNLYAVW